MEQRHLTLELLTPTFLGDAQQTAAWRTPPIKAQLRRWWRVAAFAKGMRLPALRNLEGKLFGDAAGQQGRKSQVRLRLQPQKGHLGAHYDSAWRQAKNQNQLKMSNGLPADAYLGFGRVKTKGANETALPPEEKAELRLAWPAEAEGAEALDEALGLFHRLGSLGGRSRNGWGACHLHGAEAIGLDAYSRPWEEALEEAWIHALGRDGNGLLLWWTPPCKSWEAAMRRLGDLRKGLCGEAGALRPLLSWPVTGQHRRDLGDKNRIPNTLQLKVVRDEQGQLRGQVAHLPCRPAPEIWQALPDRERREHPGLWHSAHAFLDRQSDLERVHA